MRKQTMFILAVTALIATAAVGYGQLRNHFGGGVGFLAQRFQGHWGGPHGLFMLGEYLGVDENQKSQLHTVFDTAKQATEADRQLLKAGRDQLLDAVKAGASDSELRSIAAAQSDVIARVVGEGAVAASKAYSILTPEQQTKLQTLKERFGQRFAGHMLPDPATP